MTAADHEKIAVTIKDSVAAAMKAAHDDFWIPQPQHYLDHQMLEQYREQQDVWKANHEFISSVRSGTAWGRKVGIGVVVTATLTFVGGAIWLAIKTAIEAGRS